MPVGIPAADHRIHGVYSAAANSCGIERDGRRTAPVVVSCAPFVGRHLQQFGLVVDQRMQPHQRLVEIARIDQARHVLQHFEICGLM